MVGNNLKETQLQQIVDKTILIADKVSKVRNPIMTNACFLINKNNQVLNLCFHLFRRQGDISYLNQFFIGVINYSVCILLVQNTDAWRYAEPFSSSSSRLSPKIM